MKTTGYPIPTSLPTTPPPPAQHDPWWPGQVRVAEDHTAHAAHGATTDRERGE